MKLRDYILAHADEVNAIAARYGASNLRLFGSVARGEDTQDSEVDMLAEFAHGKSYFDLVKMEYDLGGLLGRKIDIFTPQSLNPSIQSAIMREAVELPSRA